MDKFVVPRCMQLYLMSPPKNLSSVLYDEGHVTICVFWRLSLSWLHSVNRVAIGEEENDEMLCCRKYS